MALKFLNNGYFAGKVGIGTLSPSGKLEIASDSSLSSYVTQYTNDADGAELVIRTARGTETVPLQYNTGDSAGRLLFQAYTSTGAFKDAASIESVMESGSANAYGGLRFNYMPTTSPYVLTEGMRLKANGNVGIGIINPILKLHIKGTNSLPATSGTAQNGGIRIENGVNNGVLDIGASNATGAPGWLQATDKADLSQAYKLLLNPNGGNVGIGTTSPLTKLHIAGTTDANIIRIENTSTSLSLGSTIGAIQFFNNDPTDDSPNVAASIYATAGASGGSGSLRFKTTEPGAEGDPATDTMIITNGGNVGIGTASPNNLLNLQKDVADGDVAVYIQNSNAAVGSVNETASVKFAHGDDGVIGYVGGKLVCGKEGDFETSIANIKGNLQFYTASGTSLDPDINNIERMRITPGGNVGIGTTDPGSRLTVSGTNNATSEITLINTNPSTDNDWSITPFYNDQTLRFRTNSAATTVMTLKDNGNVGIGITSPIFNLQVKTPAVLTNSTYSWPFDLTRANSTTRGFSIGVQSGGGPVALGNHNGDIILGQTFGVDANGLPTFYETMRVKHDGTATSGKVGINDTSPDFTLDVGGTLGVSNLPFNTGSISALVANETIGAELLPQPLDLTTDFTANTSATTINDSDTFTVASSGTFNGITLNTSTLTFVVGAVYKLILKGTTTATNGFTFGSGGAGGNEYGSGFGNFEFTAIHNQLWVRQTGAGETSFTEFSVKKVTPTDDQIQKRELGTGAFGPTPVGAYLPLTAGGSFPLTGALNINLGSSNPSTLKLIRNTTGDSQIVGDIEFNTTAAQGTDDRIALIRAETQNGAGTSRGGQIKLYTRLSGSTSFNTTTYDVFGNWALPGRLSVQGTGDSYFAGDVAIAGVTNPSAMLQIGGLSTNNTSFNVGGIYGVDYWTKSYSASNTNILSITKPNNGALENGGAYRVTGHIPGTGTDQSSRAVFWNQDGTWYCNLTSASGTSSNSILFLIDATTGLPSVKTYHPNNYTIRVWHERINLAEETGTDNSRHYFGTDSYMSQIANDVSMFTSYSGNNLHGKLGVGIAVPGARLDVANGNAAGDAAFDFPVIRLTNTTASSDWDVGDKVGVIEYYTTDTSGNAPYVASFINSVNETGNGTLPSGALVFGTANYNASGGANEKIRLSEEGSLIFRNFVTALAAPATGYLKEMFIANVDGVGTFASNGASNGVYGSFKFITRKGDSTDPIVTMTLDNSHQVGIGTQSPNSKLQVAGGIQMADDTDNAGAAKVGTMRYRTGTEYVEVTGTEIAVNGDFASDTSWSKGTGWTIANGLASSDGTQTGPSYLTQTTLPNPSYNKTYKVTFTISNYVSGTVSVLLGGYEGTPGRTGNGTATQYKLISQVLSNTILYVQASANFVGSIDNLSVIEVTAEDASYADMCMQTGASTYEWVNIVRNTY